MPLLEEVFGVSSKPILSYIERPDVDSRFLEAIASDKEVIVYGSSKQGKSALVSKYLPYNAHLLVSLTPRMTIPDIYQTALRQAGIRLSTGATEKRGSETSAGISARVKAMIPLFGGGEAGASGKVTANSESEQKYEEVPVNLEIPQHIADLLQGAKKHEKWIIMENFHYLNDDVQRQFAFDLRSFQELGIRFVILGVWREKNRMAQFNGDLLDRVTEVPVEPWTTKDFHKVVATGGKHLNIEIDQKIIQRVVDASFASIGVFQELLKGLCSRAGVEGTQRELVRVDTEEALDAAISIKAHDYASRHQRALEAIAAGHTSGGSKSELLPLYLPYYLVRVILAGGYDAIADGIRRGDLHDRIREIHHRGNDVRASDMSNLLHGLANLQAAKSISPPIIDYDQQNRLLQVVDSTFYFFIKNANLAEIAESLQNPVAAT
jgi:hypothetical protein